MFRVIRRQRKLSEGGNNLLDGLALTDCLTEELSSDLSRLQSLGPDTEQHISSLVVQQELST